MPSLPRFAALAALPVLLGAQAPAEATRVSNWAADPSFRLVNRHSQPMHQVYVSPTGQRDWGADRLGQEVLAPGRFARITLPAGRCVNDIRVIFADGRALERRQVDTCVLAQMAFP
ncbi:hypothetical protein [Paracraurococcus ruber]|uniref:Uncharacterized protein n=1 Tax=Paracraurococcus ruber TaxID=77675 RepID=A0ABS1CTY7_9PROT|nr:hypothetical protein [Paracraurococcus ruber]MBK1657452.1 hypothetical protein [Paracraurococcus ruber]TDG32984.1 hypothetical protein E2C05_05475 [Paracraurococcus ruber]